MKKKTETVPEQPKTLFDVQVGPEFKWQTVQNLTLEVTDDGTNPAIGKYYQSKTNLPWGIHISGEFDYPIEKVPVTEAYTKFIYWIQSAGAQFPDWFMDKPGYRIPENIY